MIARATVLLGVALALSADLGAQAARPTIAVVRFTDRGSYGLDPEDAEALRVGLQEMLIAELDANPSLRVFSRTEIAELERARGLRAEAQADVTTAAQIAATGGARYLLLGSFVDLHGNFRIDIHIVNAVTAETVTIERVLKHRDAVHDMIVELAGNVTRSLNAPRLSRQAQVARQARAIPGEAVRLYSRGLLYAERGETDRALDHLNRALALYPDFEEAERARRRLRDD